MVDKGKYFGSSVTFIRELSNDWPQENTSYPASDSHGTVDACKVHVHDYGVVTWNWLLKWTYRLLSKTVIFGYFLAFRGAYAADVAS